MLTQAPTTERPLVSVIVAVYEAEHRLEALVSAIDQSLKALSYELILVDDASKDKSWDLIKHLSEGALHLNALRVLGIGLHQNIGQHMATYLGLTHGRGRYLVTLDDDLQHQPQYIHQLLSEAQHSGAEAVYGTYNQDRSWGSKLLGSLLYATKTIRSSCSSFRLLSDDLVHQLQKSQCSYIFLEALIAAQTTRISTCNLRRAPRYEGDSNYSLWRRTRMAIHVLEEFTYIFIWLGGIISVLMIMSNNQLLICVGLSIAVATLYSHLRKKRTQKNIEEYFLHIPQRTTHPIDYYENNLSRCRAPSSRTDRPS